MPIRVNIDGRGTMVFPDGTSPDVIEATVKREVGAAQPEPPAPAPTPERPKGRFQSAMDIHRQSAQYAKDAGIGILKSAGSTAYNLGKLAHKIPGMETIAPDRAGAFSEQNELTDALEPSNTAQAIGKGAGDIGQFFIPGAAQAGKLGAVSRLAGKMGLAGRMGTEAASAAGVTAAQGGDASTAAIGAAATTPVAAALGRAAPRIANTLLKPKDAAFATGANPGRGVVESGLAATSLGSLAKKIDDEMSTVGGEIGKVVGLSPAGRTPSIDVETIMNSVLDSPAEDMATAGISGEAIQKLRQGVYDRITKMGASPNAVTPAQLHAIKVSIRRAARMSPSSAAPEASANEARKTLSRRFAQEIDAAVPEVAPLNKHYSDLAEADDAVWDRLNESLAQKLGNTTGILSGSGAGLAWWSSHPAVALGVLGTRAAMGLTPTATTMAQGARAIGSQGGQKAAARTVGSGLSAITEQEMPDPRDEYFRNMMTGRR